VTRTVERGRAPLSPAGRDELQRALDAWIEHHRAPGAALTVAGTDGDPMTVVAGLADVATDTRVDVHHRFQIGSVGKSVTAIALLNLAERGLVDLDAPVDRVLPWFETSLGRRITVHELLSHTSGLPMGGDFSESGRFDVWALRDVGPGGRPGRWSYSNVGYKVLGFVIEAVAGRSYGEVLGDAILAPLGMRDSRPVVTWAERDGEVTGYEPAPDAFPMSRAPRVAAPWMDLTTGDGSTSASAPDMARYVAMLLRGGTGETGTRILGDASFARLVGRHARIRPGLWAGYGLNGYRLDGRRTIAHGGDMVGFGSSLVADLDTGIGAVALANLRDAPCRQLTVFALRLARAERGLGVRPSLDLAPAVDPGLAFEGGDALNGARMVLGVDRGTAQIEIDGIAASLIPLGGDEFEVDHPVLGRYLLRLQRGPDGAVRATTHARHRFTARPGNVPHGRLTRGDRAAVGRYRSHNPWRRTFDVVDRHGRLILIEANGNEEPLTRQGRGSYRVGTAGSPEWIRFDAIVDGRAMRASATAHPYYRTDDGPYA
jgi:D-alanyl-D-alanine carboxypeptidase